VKPKLRWHRINRVQHYNELTTLFTISSATGEFARASASTSQISTPSIQGTSIQGTLIPVSHCIRTRGVLLQDDSSDSSRKRLKTGSDQAIDLLTSLLKDRQKPQGRVRFNTVELAIQLLQIKYETRLSEGHFLIAIDVLIAEPKASVFITLNSSIRDIWLCKTADITLI
jgi:hypothetical protein